MKRGLVLFPLFLLVFRFATAEVPLPAVPGVLAARPVVITEDFVGRIFPLDIPAKDPAFFQKIHVTPTDARNRFSTSVIEDKDGVAVLRERAVIKDGLIVEQDIDQLQSEERFELRVRDGRLFFKTFKMIDGVLKVANEKDEELPADLVVGPSVEVYLRDRSAKLIAGEKVDVQFAIAELSRTVEFEFKLHQATEKLILLKMKPTSFWLSLLVDTMELDFDRETFHLQRFKGRIPVRRKIHGRWKAFDAETFYSEAK